MESIMGQLVVRNLEDDVKERLKERARQHGNSLEKEVRDILRDAVKDRGRQRKLGSEIAALFKDIGFEAEIEEIRGYPVQPAKFDECSSAIPPCCRPSCGRCPVARSSNGSTHRGASQVRGVTRES